jgi:hypothetical protein
MAALLYPELASSKMLACSKRKNFSQSDARKRQLEQNVFLKIRALFWPAGSCASPPPRPSIFTNYYLLVHHPVYQDDRHLLAYGATYQNEKKYTK